MRRLRKQQDRCQMTLAEKSNNYYVKSHGFASSRTVSCKFQPLCTKVIDPLGDTQYHPQ